MLSPQGIHVSFVQEGSNQGRGGVFHKRQANKRVRKHSSVQDGGMYRKVFCSYDICDWRPCYWSKAFLAWKISANRNWANIDPEKEWRVARMK